LSGASIWEIAIKAGLGRPDFAADPATIASVALVADLPGHHRDPFDRPLVAQAMAEPAQLGTADALLEPNSELVRLVRAGPDRAVD
jgi:PIN domain nuclease of toxin-antitoxin system